MLVRAELRPLGPTDLAFRRRALRDAIVCIGWIKLLSIFMYMMLLILTYANSEGTVSFALQIMIFVLIPTQIINAAFLFVGALEKKSYALQISLWLIMIIAAYNTVLGMIGGIYFIRTGHLTVHFFTSLLYGLLAFSIISVMCHDIIVIYTYNTLIQGQHSHPTPESRTPSLAKVP